MGERVDGSRSDGLCLTTVQGVMPPAAVHGLARRLAELVDAGLDAPLCASRVVVDGRGGVHLKSGRVSRRWRAPELREGADDGMAHTLAGDRWALGRLVLEVALGTPVADAVVDDASVERLQGLRDLERRALPPSLVITIAGLLKRKPEDRSFVDASDNAVDVEDRALARFVEAQRGRPKTVALESRAIVDEKRLRKLAREMSGKFSLKSLENERTGDMPAAAILNKDDLARLGGVPVALPTQMLMVRPAMVPTAPAQRSALADDLLLENTVPTEIEPILPPVVANETPTWIPTVSIEPPETPTVTATVHDTPPASTKTKTREKKPKTQEKKPKTQERMAAAHTTVPASTLRRSKVVPRTLVAVATLMLALAAAAVGVHQTQKMTTPAKPILY